MYSNFINLEDYFMNCKEEYCIIRISDCFPNYREGSDIDILCKDQKQMVEYTANYLKQYPDININIHYPENGKHAHVDVCLEKGILNLKFDFIDSFSMYNKNNIKSEFKNEVLNNKIKTGSIFIPSKPHEMVIRMLEYLEYIDARPDKIKHLKYVESNTEYRIEFKSLWKTYISTGDIK